MSNKLHGVSSRLMIIFYLYKKWVICKVSGAVVRVPTTGFARVVAIVANALGMVL